MDKRDERARRINEAIAKSGYSYPELEKITGIPKSTIQRYATGGSKKVDFPTVQEIANAVGADPRYLLCWENETEISQETQSAIDLIKKDEDVQIYVNALGELTEAQRAAVIRTSLNNIELIKILEKENSKKQ